MSEYDKELQSDSKEVDEAESKLGRGEKRQDDTSPGSRDAAHSSDRHPDESQRRKP
jgi:hypothetical protein